MSRRFVLSLFHYEESTDGVSQALVYSRLAINRSSADFSRCTKAVLFFGTPHYGSSWSAAHAAFLKVHSLFAPATPAIAMLLSKNSEHLAQLQSDFALFGGTLRTRYFFVELRVHVGIKRILVGVNRSPKNNADHTHQIVSHSSAVPDNSVHGIKLHKNHIDMVKFDSITDHDYRVVLSEIQAVLSDMAGPQMAGGRVDVRYVVPHWFG